MERLLLVDNDDPFVEALTQRLLTSGFTIDVYPSNFMPYRHDLIVVSLDYSAGNGLEMIRALRKSHECSTIFACSQRCAPADIVVALDAGADDFLEKKIDFDVLEAKLRQARRRSATCQRAQCIDPSYALVDNLDAQLTRFEQRLLRLLTRRSGEVVSRDILAQQLWGRATVESKLLYEHISTLRSKLRFAHWTIVNVRGRGYRLEAMSPSVDDWGKSQHALSRQFSG